MSATIRPHGDPVSILVAEDSATQAESLQHLLQQHGYEVRIAHDGRRALELARQRRPTLVISDIVMPSMNGYELCKAIKSEKKLNDVPVILLTTLANTQDVILGLECGATNFLRKPYDDSHLLARIDYVLMNTKLRKNQKVQAGLEIELGGTTHFITSDRQQILDLLISTYEQAVQVNEELQRAQGDTERANRELHARALEADAANQAKSMFLAAMSHEIRTPLIGVLGMLEVMGHSRMDVEQRRQFSIVNRSAHALLEVIGDILDYSKIEAGKVELTPEVVSIRDLVARVTSNFSATAQSKGLRLAQVVDASVAPAHVVDAVRLMQILRNLVSNAIKFTDRGSVTIAVRAAEGNAERLLFSVADTGVGIAPAQLDRLFQPFVQADVGTTRRFDGSGLGLAICRRLAELMGGTIRADSTLGRGTVMTLELQLPLGRAEDVAAVTMEDVPPVATRAKPTREQAQHEGSLLLLAEDHPINREVLTRQLDLAGFVVDAAEDGMRALEQFGTGAYGLVLTDLHMPGLDGYQLTAAIRELERGTGRPRTPIIALTANVLREVIDRCLAGGMDDYVSKPVTIRQLIETLRRWLPQLDWEGRSWTDAPVDHSVLEQFSGGDVAKGRALLLRYCQSAAEDLRALDDAQRQSDGAGAAGVAHRIRGAALMIGAREVAGIAQQIEQLARQSSMDRLAGLASGLRHALARLEVYVQELPA